MMGDLGDSTAMALERSCALTAVALSMGTERVLGWSPGRTEASA